MQALNNAFFFKIKTYFFAECRRVTLGKGAVMAAFLCRVPSWHSGNPLPSARHAALGKEAFAVKGYADSSLPSAALGKARVYCSDSGLKFLLGQN